jgi:SAM-dependent methyltransferase
MATVRSDRAAPAHDHLRFDRIGTRYSKHRRADHRIARQVERALGRARSVVNIGAGTGSYEPEGRRVVAVEPSAVMIAQRHRRAAPAVRARAEELPFPDRCFDAAMATLSVHHWSDLEAGMAEMRRVVRDRCVIFTWEQEVLNRNLWFIADYLPELGELDRALFPDVAEVASHLLVDRVEVVPVPADCTDGFGGAYWRRPEAYLDPAVRSSISGLALLEERVVARGVARLARELENGTWDAKYGHLRNLPELDLGYRLIVGR